MCCQQISGQSYKISKKNQINIVKKLKISEQRNIKNYRTISIISKTVLPDICGRLQ